MIKLIGLPLPTPLAPRARSTACHWPPGRATRSWSLRFCSKALAEEIAHMARACAIVNLTMGAGTRATVALEQSLPYFGVALTGTRYHEVMDHLKGQARSAEHFFVSWSQSRGTCGLLKKCLLQRSDQVCTDHTHARPLHGEFCRRDQGQGEGGGW